MRRCGKDRLVAKTCLLSGLRVSALSKTVTPMPSNFVTGFGQATLQVTL